MKIITIEDGKVYWIRTNKTLEKLRELIPEAFEYSGPWPEEAEKFKWDYDQEIVVEDTEVTPEEEENNRKLKIAEEKEISELHKVTPEQAYQYIDNQLDSASTAAETKEAVRKILKKMVPFILE